MTMPEVLILDGVVRVVREVVANKNASVSETDKNT